MSINDYILKEKINKLFNNIEFDDETKLGTYMPNMSTNCSIGEENSG